MPPPKFAPVKKRSHSKRTIDFGRTKSAPVTPVERSPVKEVIVEETDGVGRQALQRLEDLWPKALPRKLPRGGGRADE